jgi:hypothetical protein
VIISASTGLIVTVFPAGERYGPWFLFGLFAAILVWEEVWDLPHSAALSGWLLVLITAGAAAFSAVFERRFWCRSGGRNLSETSLRGGSAAGQGGGTFQRRL